MPVVTCLSCDAKNKVERYSVTQLPVCGRCGSKLFEPRYIKSFRFFKKNWAWVVLISLGGGAWIANSASTSKKHRNPSSGVSEPSMPSCTQVAVSSGIYRVYTHHKKVAPFKIITPRGSNYYAKLVDSNTARNVISMYAVGGRTSEVVVPLGSYRLKYAYGNAWCGESLLFGEQTKYGEAQSTFEFSVQGSRISGYTVKLIPQVHGNLKTKSISASDF